MHMYVPRSSQLSNFIRTDASERRKGVVWRRADQPRESEVGALQRADRYVYCVSPKFEFRMKEGARKGNGVLFIKPVANPQYDRDSIFILPHKPKGRQDI